MEHFTHISAGVLWLTLAPSFMEWAFKEKMITGLYFAALWNRHRNISSLYISSSIFQSSFTMTYIMREWTEGEPCVSEPIKLDRQESDDWGHIWPWCKINVLVHRPNGWRMFKFHRPLDRSPFKKKKIIIFG